jgi:hypothetical protein
MSAPMTLEEAVREVQADGFGMCSPAARAALLAHAERTVAARSGEPEWLTTTRMTRFLPRDRKAEALAYIDTLTAELAAARQEFAEWPDAFGKGLETHAEVVADRERLAAMVERVMTPAFIDNKVAWSRETFGPGERTTGVCAHLRKEIDEAEREPRDASEWADIVLLAMDGAGRHGIDGASLLSAIYAKDAQNRTRTWPDWRTVAADAPIEHLAALEAPNA